MNTKQALAFARRNQIDRRDTMSRNDARIDNGFARRAAAAKAALNQKGK